MAFPDRVHTESPQISVIMSLSTPRLTPTSPSQRALKELETLKLCLMKIKNTISQVIRWRNHKEIVCIKEFYFCLYNFYYASSVSTWFY